MKCTKTRLTAFMTWVRMRKERLIEMSDCTVYNIPAAAGEANKDQADHSHDQGEDEE